MGGGQRAGRGDYLLSGHTRGVSDQTRRRQQAAYVDSRRGRSQLDPGGKHQSDETGAAGETGGGTEAAFHIPNK